MLTFNICPNNSIMLYQQTAKRAENLEMSDYTIRDLDMLT